ncbi:efflux RND transporter permease subunit, partial [Acinetobacter baumannii]|uniref:efflux RND transporter permease subunit n=1 Tax=Acinetobacter baumannii TaxID=470 RepID=UPI00129D9A71
EKIRGILLNTPTGQQIRLEDVAQVMKEEAPSQIMRRNEKEFVAITADITSNDKEGVSTAQNEAVKKMKLPEGVTV